MDYDVVIVGGGPSGMSAGMSATSVGAKTLILERDVRLGGVLNQCIHNGFGMSYFNEELTGPEYAYKLAKMVKEKNVDVKLNAFVSNIDEKNNIITVISENGFEKISYKALVLACGCRERTAGSISLCGTRPSGVYPAGLVQKMINHYGKLPGKEAVILGSGDIGLVMAKRLTLEGVKVKGVFEIMKSSSGLARNITQCLQDFEIPMYYGHTISRVVGNEKVEGIYFAKVDENLKPIKETEKFVKCDTVLLSVGLIPENDLLENKIEMDKKTKSAVVNEYRQTSIKNIFVSGNVLHIHDLADNATIEGKIAGENAGLYAMGKLKKDKTVVLNHSENISYTIPQVVSIRAKKFSIFYRVKNKISRKKVVLKSNGEIIAQKMLLAVNPGEMQELQVNVNCDLKNLFLTIE